MSRLKRSWIVMANIALMVAMVVFVVFYSGYEKSENYRNQVDHFVNATIAMERVTGNYLEGEQGICDNWAQYINSQDMTLEEAAAYIRATHSKSATSAHLVDTETLTGWSSRPRPGTEDNYSVSYERLDLFGDGAWIADTGTAVRSCASTSTHAMAIRIIRPALFFAVIVFPPPLLVPLKYYFAVSSLFRRIASGAFFPGGSSQSLWRKPHRKPGGYHAAADPAGHGFRILPDLPACHARGHHLHSAVRALYPDAGRTDLLPARCRNDSPGSSPGDGGHRHHHYPEHPGHQADQG